MLIEFFFPRCDVLGGGVVSTNSSEIAWIGALYNALEARGKLMTMAKIFNYDDDDAMN